MNWFQRGYQDGFTVPGMILAIGCAVLAAVVVLVALVSPGFGERMSNCHGAAINMTCDSPTTTTTVQP